MMVDIVDVIASARFSWQCNYSIATPRWRLTQLHRLYQLLLDSRDDLVAILSNGQDVTPEAYESELALVVRELNGHISHLSSLKPNQEPVKSGRGENRVSYLPIGVNLVISESKNRFRSLFLPLAASIAAGNVTVIATIAGNDGDFISLFSHLWNKYLDGDCNFFVPNFRLSELDLKDVDLVSIYGLVPKPYGSILSSNKAKFHSTAPGYNLALITEGKKQWEEIAADVAQSCQSAHMFWEDCLHAVFVRTEDYAELSGRLLQHGISTTSVDTTKPEHSTFDLAVHLEACRKACTLVIISVNSIGRAVDIMIESSSTTQQLALLGPQAYKMASFVEPWLNVKVLSVGSIYTVPISESQIGEFDLISDLLISPTLFSRTVLKTTTKGKMLPKTTPEIRASYQNLIKPLKPEHDGKRVGFFTQVEYVVKGVGITAGLFGAVGAVYLARWALQRVR